jgi:hypothetical protein
VISLTLKPGRWLTSTSSRDAELLDIDVSEFDFFRAIVPSSSEKIAVGGYRLRSRISARRPAWMSRGSQPISTCQARR